MVPNAHKAVGHKPWAFTRSDGATLLFEKSHTGDSSSQASRTNSLSFMAIANRWLLACGERERYHVDYVLVALLV